MVNTFITTGAEDEDYVQTAKHLDPQRLWKQKLEAQQILQILEDLDTIAQYYKWEPIPSVKGKESSLSPEDWADLIIKRNDWVKETRARYLELPVRLVSRKGELEEWPIEMVHNLPRLHRTDKVEVKNSIVTITFGRSRKIVTYKRSDILLRWEDERAIMLGYSQNAIVRMWAGYQKSLKVYIEAHYAVWKSRDAREKEELQDIKIPSKTVHPWWRNFEGVYLSHRAALIRKETTGHRPNRFDAVEGRHETSSWYGAIKSFNGVLRGREKVWLDHGYVWANNLECDKIVRILSGEILSPEEIACPIKEPLNNENRPVFNNRRPFNDRRESTFGASPNGRGKFRIPSSRSFGPRFDRPSGPRFNRPRFDQSKKISKQTSTSKYMTDNEGFVVINFG